MTVSRQRTNTLEPAVLQQSVVVFSKNYLPMARINIKRAVTLLITGRAKPLDLLPGKVWEIHSPSIVLRVPDQIQLTFASGERTWKAPPVNRREVLRRDHHSCQYCGSTRHLTLDHIIPLSKGGKHSWDNVVAACERCNQTKGDRTPEQAGMPLHTKPKPPVHPSVAFAEQFWKEGRGMKDEGLS
jgi:5-methylcytosine-specific restriction endonuclease McrA